MSTQLPRLEARVSAVERMQSILHARIEEVSEDTAIGYRQLKDYQIQSEHRLDELSRDMTASFKQLADYQIQTERKIDERFDKIEGDIVAMEGRLKGDMAAMEAKMATKEDMAVMEGRLKGDMAAMEAKMATKEDMAVMETRILSAFKQLLTVIDSRLPPPQA